MVDRLHLFEIIDQSWCPRVLRQGVVEYLGFIATKGAAYRRALPVLGGALERAGGRRVVDLGSGSGGPWAALRSELEAELGDRVEVTLTDRHPEALSPGTDGLRVHPDPVDAARVPAELEGFRTLFSLFHHFRPSRARAILADAVARGQGIGVFEMTMRSPWVILLMATSPVFMLLVTPFVRPFRWSRLLLTYLIPVIPLVTAFDGVVSCLRTYTPAELLVLAEQAGPGYRWEARTVSAFPPSPIPVTYLVGTPAPLAAPESMDAPSRVFGAGAGSNRAARRSSGVVDLKKRRC